MVTTKFGGTAMTPQNFSCLDKFVDDNCGCVVVSAIGKEQATDVKTTDLLKAHFCGDGTAWQKIQQKYRRLVQCCGVKIDVDKLLFSAKSRSKISLDYCMSLGEEMTAKIVAEYLKSDYVEAQDVLTFNRGKLDFAATKRNLKSAFKGVKMGVVGGFYGGDNNTRAVFSRGGSDVTGALCAVALGSSLYYNVTDANGVCKANPKQIDDVETIKNISYGQMYALAKGGAEVLHPDAVRYAERYGVPICVSNFHNDGNSTLVGNYPCQDKFLAVTERRIPRGIATTLLHGMTQTEVAFCMQKLAKTLEKRHFCGNIGITYGEKFCYTVSQNCVKIISEHSILTDVYNAFCVIQKNG